MDSSQIISFPVSPPTLRPVTLLKSSQQMTSTKVIAEKVWARPYNVNDLKASLEANVWHNRCIQFKATCMVGLGFGVWPKGAKIGEDEPYPEDELYKKYPWLLQANEDESFLEIAIEMAMDREAVGDGWWEVERSLDGEIKALYHVPGETMWLKKGKEFSIAGYTQRVNNIYYQFRRFGETTGLTNKKGDKINELIRFKNPMIGSAWYGTPDWLPAIRAIALALSAHDFNYAFFTNSAIPAWLMIVKGGTLSDAVQADVIKFFHQNFQGAIESHRLLKIEYDDKELEIEFTRITAKIEDMSFEKLENSTRDEIIAANGMPPRVMGISTPGRLGGGGDVKDELRLFKEITIRPKQKLLEDRINMTLFAESGDRIKFNEIDIAPVMPTVADDTEEALLGETEPVEKFSKARGLIDAMMELRKLVIESDEMGDLDAIL